MHSAHRSVDIRSRKTREERQRRGQCRTHPRIVLEFRAKSRLLQNWEFEAKAEMYKYFYQDNQETIVASLTPSV